MSLFRYQMVHCIEKEINQAFLLGEGEVNFEIQDFFVGDMEQEHCVKELGVNPTFQNMEWLLIEDMKRKVKSPLINTLIN